MNKMPVNLVTLGVIVIAGLIFIELFKHILFKKVYRILFFILVISLALIFISGFLSSQGIIDSENQFVVTGASILDNIEDNIGKETLNNLTSPIKKIDKNDLRKLYK